MLSLRKLSFKNNYYFSTLALLQSLVSRTVEEFSFFCLICTVLVLKMLSLYSTVFTIFFTCLSFISCKNNDTKECVWSVDCVCKNSKFTKCTNVKNFPKFSQHHNLTLTELNIDGSYTDIPTKAFQFTESIPNVYLRGRNDLRTTIQPSAFSGTIFKRITLFTFKQLTIDPEAFFNSSFGSLFIKGVKSLVLPNGVFNQTNNFQSLELYYTGLRNVTRSGKSSFLQGLKLTKLDLSYNNLDLGSLEGILDVKDTVIHFACVACGLTDIPEELGSFTKLQSIDLRDNNISKLSTKVFQKLTNLNTLLLSNNPIGKGSLAALSDIKKISSFRTFKCNNCNLKEIPREISTHPYLKKLALDYNNITVIREKDFDGTASKLPDNEGIHLSLINNQINKIEPKSMVSLKWSYILLNNNLLKEFDMSLIPNKADNPRVTNGLSLTRMETLQRVYVSNVEKAPRNCSVIDISGSGVREVDKNVFFVCMSENEEKQDVVIMRKLTHFDCSKDLRWMATCALCADTEEGSKECRGNRIGIAQSTCDNTTTLSQHFREVYSDECNLTENPIPDK